MGEPMDEEIRKVQRNIRKDLPMSAEALMDEARSRVVALVDRRAINCGKMRAYEEIGSLIGRSPSWIDKLIGRRLDTKRPDAVALQNIKALYERICQTTEHVADKLERRADDRDKKHAATASNRPDLPGDMAAHDAAKDWPNIPPFLRRE